MQSSINKTALRLLPRGLPVITILVRATNISGRSVANSLHILEQNLLAAGGHRAWWSVASDSLGASRVPSFSKKFVMPVARNERGE